MQITVVLLCFSMGLRNAVITKLSRAEIRTTHITGIVTDIGIEIGKLFAADYSADQRHVVAVRTEINGPGRPLVAVVCVLTHRHTGCDVEHSNAK